MEMPELKPGMVVADKDGDRFLIVSNSRGKIFATNDAEWIGEVPLKNEIEFIYIAVSNATIGELLSDAPLELIWERKPAVVDWSKVAVDTPILVRDKELHLWKKRHFALVDEDGKVGVYYDGKTSFTENNIWFYSSAVLYEGNQHLLEENN